MKGTCVPPCDIKVGTKHASHIWLVGSTASPVQKWRKWDCTNPWAGAQQSRDATSNVLATKRRKFAATTRTEVGHTRRRIAGMPMPHKEMCRCGLCV